MPTAFDDRIYAGSHTNSLAGTLIFFFVRYTLSPSGISFSRGPRVRNSPTTPVSEVKQKEGRVQWICEQQSSSRVAIPTFSLREDNYSGRWVAFPYCTNTTKNIRFCSLFCSHPESLAADVDQYSKLDNWSRRFASSP